MSPQSTAPSAAMVDHGVDEELGVLISVLNALEDGTHVVGTQVGDEPCLSGYALEQLVFGVFSTEAKAYEVGCGEAAGTLG